MLDNSEDFKAYDGDGKQVSLTDLLNEAVRIYKCSVKVDMRYIKEATGWELGFEGKWKYEIEDPFCSNEILNELAKIHYGEQVHIERCMSDFALLEAYPSFYKLNLFVMYSSRERMAGYFNPGTNAIVVSMGEPSDKFEYQIGGVLLHEVQHLIQHLEGFAKGGGFEFGRNTYLRLAGEVESRNVVIRHELTKEERRKSLRTDTQDVPDSEQLLDPFQ